MCKLLLLVGCGVSTKLPFVEEMLAAGDDSEHFCNTSLSLPRGLSKNVQRSFFCGGRYNLVTVTLCLISMFLQLRFWLYFKYLVSILLILYLWPFCVKIDCSSILLQFTLSRQRCNFTCLTLSQGVLPKARSLMIFMLMDGLTVWS